MGLPARKLAGVIALSGIYDPTFEGPAARKFYDLVQAEREHRQSKYR